MAWSQDWSGAVKEAKRELLLNAARNEFADKGLEGATMRSIAHRAGCTTGAMYPLFESKEAIYAALLEQSLFLLDNQIADAVSVVREPKLRVDAACPCLPRVLSSASLRGESRSVRFSGT